VEVVGDKAAAERIMLVGERALDVRPARPAIAPIFATEERRRFDMEGPGWEQLQQDTRDRKEKMGLDSRILRATGALFHSLTNPDGGVEASMLSSPQELRFGTNVPYAGFHQTGTSRMPARPPIELSPAAAQEMTVAVQAYIVEGAVV